MDDRRTTRRCASNTAPPTQTIPMMPNTESGTGWVEVVQARGLHAMDKGGTSDPFVVVSSGKQKKQTKVVKKNLAPSWNEKFNKLRDPKKNCFAYANTLASLDEFDAQINKPADLNAFKRVLDANDNDYGLLDPEVEELELDKLDKEIEKEKRLKEGTQ